MDLASFPARTRCIVRREPLHPGAQRSLFPSLEFRYVAFYTDLDGDPVALDLQMRAHAHVESHIQRLKDSGLCRFPFTSFEANATWLLCVTLGADLVRWFQLLCLDGEWRDARPKALRWELFHVPGRLVRRARRVIVRILRRVADCGTSAPRLPAHRTAHLTLASVARDGTDVPLHALVVVTDQEWTPEITFMAIRPPNQCPRTTASRVSPRTSGSTKAQEFSWRVERWRGSCLSIG